MPQQEQMAMKAIEFKDYCANVLASRRNFSSQYSLYRFHEAGCVTRVADTANSLNQVNILEISSLFSCFFDSSVNVADAGQDFSYDFTINFHGELLWL